MRQTLQTIYRTAAAEFARRVTSALGDRVDALVLFGSVARGEATRSSDIDIVVISPNPAATRETISWIRSDLTYEHRFTFFISLIHWSRREFDMLSHLCSPFLEEVVTEGVILYDNGTFSRVREKTPAVSR